MLDEYQREEALIHFQRGLVLERAHRVDEAVEEYRRAIAHYPHLREAHDALGFYYQRHGLLAKAAEEFRVVANLEGGFLAYFNLGYVLIELGRHDEAMAAFQRCLELEPDDPATAYEISRILFIRGDYPKALEYLQLALHAYPNDWEIYQLLGRCRLQLGFYDEALAAFGRALNLAPEPSAQARAIEQIDTVDRYREVGRPRWARDRLYAEHGVVYLGSAQDDGLQIEESQDYHFTYPDIVTTLRRLKALCDGRGWRFSCVVPLDRLARPLADALAYLLDAPPRAIEDVRPDDLPLLVLSVGREAELLELAIERAASVTVTFCLSLNWLRHSSALPDIIGVIARGASSVPWEPEMRRLRADGAPAERVSACLAHAAEQIIAAMSEIPSDTALARQVRYYGRHHRLRFAEVFQQMAPIFAA